MCRRQRRLQMMPNSRQGAPNREKQIDSLLRAPLVSFLPTSVGSHQQQDSPNQCQSSNELKFGSMDHGAVSEQLNQNLGLTAENGMSHLPTATARRNIRWRCRLEHKPYCDSGLNIPERIKKCQRSYRREAADGRAAKGI